MENIWEKRFKYLAEQFWVESEATFRLGLVETDDYSHYFEQLINAIDDKVKEL